MPLNDLSREVTTPATGVPDLSSFEAVTGDVLNFTPAATIGSSTVTLVQKPSGSSASVSSGAFTCDVAGVYLVTLANAGFARSWTVYAFAAATLGAKFGNSGASVINRSHLRGLAINAGPLGAGGASTLRAALEGTTPTNLGPINWSVFV
jgi:hypothetical protein